ncbi:MAG TPA: histidinol-phosphatase [Solirubrobacteraceae bacterium]|nr:histidinol-phosphatase [Solirubrobacteraceae bacterium]
MNRNPRVLTDYHLHLRSDALDATAAEYFTQTNAQRYRAAAEARGIAELGVSEHIYRFSQALDVWRHPFWRQYAHDDLDAYCAFVREQTDLRLGIEADFIPGSEERIASLLAARDFDYVVGSIHFVGDRALDTEEYGIWHGDPSPERVWRSYFQMLGDSAQSGLFDVLAHPDLVKMWGPHRPRPRGDLRRYYELAMPGIAASQIAVEVSTAGLRKPVGEIYPAPEFLQMALQAGAPVALSSDAHSPKQVGADYDEALELLAGLGVTELCLFERRERRLVALGDAARPSHPGEHPSAPARAPAGGGPDRVR